jgi:hypothetical protein
VGSMPNDTTAESKTRTRLRPIDSLAAGQLALCP